MPDIYLEFYDQLLAEAQMAGRDLAITCVRSGGRKSMQGGPDVAANVADAVTRGGQTRIGVHGGNTNLVSTVLTDWTKGSATIVTDNGDYTYRAQMADGSDTFISFPVAFDSDDYTIALEWRKTPNQTSNGTMRIVSVGGVGSTFATGLTAPEEWEAIDFSEMCDTANTSISISDVISSGGIDIEIRNIRFGLGTAKMPAHLDGTGAGDTYGADVVTVTPTYGSVGTIYQEVVPYGWTSPFNPVSPAYNRFYTATEEYSVFANTDNASLVANSVPNYTVPDIVTAGRVVDGVLSALSTDWDGVKAGMTFDDIARSEVSNTYAPSGETCIGNRVSDGARCFNGLLSFLSYGRVLPQSDYDELMAGGAANWANYWT